MMNSKIFKLNAVILLASFLGSFQMGLAQTTQVETPIVAANSSDIKKAADTKINHVTYGLPPKPISAEIEALDKKSRVKSIIERIRYRDIKSIKWPADSLENSNAFKMDKSYDKSIFGLVGLPIHFASIVIQSLALLLLILNFFLLYKFFRSSREMNYVG